MLSRECEVCGAPFTARRQVDKTCSTDCQIQWRRKLSRDSVARRYVPRPPRPDTACESCSATVPAPKSGPMPRWCSTCRASQEDQRARERIAVRRCYKCQTPLPNAERKPGKAVCDTCRVDKRDRGREHEQRRRLRRYGITQEQYDKLLADQGNRCPGCATDDPGVKGWSIDHSHASGRVRALLCMRCNTMLGLADEDPTMLRRLADFAERMNDIEQDKDMV